MVEMLQPLMPTGGGRDFVESFLVSYAIMRIHSNWIRSFLSSNITQPFTDKLKEGNVLCSVKPPDISFNGSSGGLYVL